MLWDGYADKAKFVAGKPDPALAVCVDNGAAKVLNADLPNKAKNPKVVELRCTLPPLPAANVVFAGPVPTESKIPAPGKS